MFISFENDSTSQSIQGISSFLSKEECEIIVDFSLKKIAKEAEIGNAEKNNKIRKNKVSWLNEHDISLAWLYKKIIQALKEINDNVYKFNIYGLTEEIQFTQYTEINDHYDWHTDSGPNTNPRKLSIVIQLSDPKDYEGCELTFLNQTDEFTKELKKQGSLIIFPSYLAHKVIPLIKGKRYSLVCWVGGPNFK